MNIPYHKIDSRILEYEIDSIEFKFGMWITKKEFGQRLNNNNPLPKGQFFMSVRVVAKDIEITEMIARRLIKQFTKLDIIRLVASSKNPKQGSIYEYLVQVENNTVENIVVTQLEHSKSERTKGLEDNKEHSKNTYNNTVDNTSKNKNKRKENIYNTIFDFWISKNVRKHRALTNEMKKAIDKALKEYSKDEILEAINNYGDMYNDLNYQWCNYQWGLNEFLVRKDKDGIRQIGLFLNDGSKYLNYLKVNEMKTKKVEQSNDSKSIEIEEFLGGRV
ncbi:hypothetical protein [Clostridium sp.]|uniref:hypothetical protein n=1 Tax=Clostridium sp. TaxID=1506 RepID=UPI0025BD69A3|nr:hypothetical protein [Clostridium sp.]